MKGRPLLICATALLFTENRACALEVPKNIYNGLATEDFRTREAAQSDLLQWGRMRREPAMKELLRQSRVAADPEVRQRCRQVLRQLVIDEYLQEGQGYIGIFMEERLVKVPGVADPRYGIDIGWVVPSSPAEVAGLMRADTIVGLGDQVWGEPGARAWFAEKIKNSRPSTTVTLKILRGEKSLSIPVVLGRKPPEQQGQAWNPEASDRAAKEAYFRDWLGKQKLPE